MSRFERITGIPAPTRLDVKQSLWAGVLLGVGVILFAVWVNLMAEAMGNAAAPSQLDRIEAKLDQLIQLQDQTVDFLSDLHAEKEKAR